jgi:mRNA-degrading endonuclease RelE of RelBE toxin-antitoxin system
MAFNKINHLPEFDKDLKKLAKRFRTIEEDLQILIDHGLVAFHKFNIDNGVVEIEGLGISYPKIFKVRKFACRSLKGKGANSGLRLIYAYYADKDEIELIEIYFKGDKENEDRGRISKYYKK